MEQPELMWREVDSEDDCAFLADESVTASRDPYLWAMANYVKASAEHFEYAEKNLKRNLDKTDYMLPEDQWREKLDLETEQAGPFGAQRRSILAKRRKRVVEADHDREQLYQDLLSKVAEDIYGTVPADHRQRLLTGEYNLRLKAMIEDLCAAAAVKIPVLPEVELPRLANQTGQIIQRLLDTVGLLSRHKRLQEHPILGKDNTADLLEEFVVSNLVESGLGEHIVLGQHIYERYQEWLLKLNSVDRRLLKSEIKTEKDLYRLMSERGFRLTRQGNPGNKTKIIGVKLTDGGDNCIGSDI